MSVDGEASNNASDTRFQTLFEQAPFSMQLLSADGRTLRVNEAWRALWQTPDDPELMAYLLGEYNVLTDPQLEAKGITPYLRRAFAGETVTVPPVRYDPAEMGRPGPPRWVKASAHPLKGDDGTVRELMLIHEDVSQQVENERALRGSELRLKQLANTIPQLAWMADAEGAVHWYNDRWYDYTGTTPAQMQGWGWQRVHDAQALPQVLERWKHSLATGEPFQMTFPLKGRDGRFRPFFTLVAPLKDDAGRVVQWFGTNTDVSALHDAEQNLRQAEERLRLAIQAGHIGIWDWDVTQDRVSWSDEVYRLHGLTPGRFGGRAADFAALVHPDDRGAVSAKLQQAATDHGPAGFSAEFRTLTPEGPPRWLSAWASVHRDADGRATRMVGATISIDAYKQAEAALRDSDRRKDEFLAMLAHELRNPLAPISTSAHLLQLHLPDGGQLRRAAEIVARQARHITELVDDLLDVSRVTRGLIELERRPVDLKSVVAHAIEQARPAIEARGHALTTWAGAEHARVLGDATRLVQAIVNLLNNAARYTPPGGRISLRVETRGAEVAIAVQDNGSGIDAALLPHVFELFTQGARSPGRAEGGLGIGLALVKGIVELHGGSVVAGSDGPDRGTTVTLALPLLAGTDTPLPQADEMALPAADRPLCVMVVDDNLDAAASLQMLLGSAGHRVVVKHDAAGALAGVDETAPEVFILDIGLPDMDGYELARRLRARAVPAVFIALTGYGQAQDRARSKAAGFDHHLVKPVDARLLAKVMTPP